MAASGGSSATSPPRLPYLPLELYTNTRLTVSLNDCAADERSPDGNELSPVSQIRSCQDRALAVWRENLQDRRWRGDDPRALDASDLELTLCTFETTREEFFRLENRLEAHKRERGAQATPMIAYLSWPNRISHDDICELSLTYTMDNPESNLLSSALRAGWSPLWGKEYWRMEDVCLQEGDKAFFKWADFWQTRRDKWTPPERGLGDGGDCPLYPSLLICTRLWEWPDDDSRLNAFVGQTCSPAIRVPLDKIVLKRDDGFETIIRERREGREKRRLACLERLTALGIL